MCGLKSREQLMLNMGKVLKLQGNQHVEILASVDNGETPIGKKRNELLGQSKGEYVCFVDDDDMISPYYVHNILNALETKPDCVGIEGVIVQKNQPPRLFIHSLKYKEWFEENGIYYRCPNHLNPIKREIACSVGFPEKYYHEDRDFSLVVKDKLSTEVYIHEPIYYYYPSN
jgi:cellulose synthase/poly-beta-1,6-N-acetylglucosamine synthase-like glycosyltransferase